MPGPAMIYASAQTLARGRRAGFMAALGIHLGGYVHVGAAALGLAAIFQYVPAAYAALKFAGAAYLVWLGISILRTRPSLSGVPQAALRSARRAFFESVAVEVLNPKTALFFIAFLPQFVEPGAGLAVAVQFLILGTVVNLTFSSADLVVVFLASSIMARLRRGNAAGRWIKIAGGSLLVGLGLRLAMMRD